jgi:hypothetical protein
VTRAAEARRAASMSSSSSTTFSAGGLVGCTMNTSAPRTFSSMRTKISPSANRVTFARVSSIPSERAISSANGRLAVPVSSLSRWWEEAVPSIPKP